MDNPSIDPARFRVCITEALDYYAIKLVEMEVQASPTQITKVRADIEDFTMRAIESSILPHLPAEWCWQKAARLIAVEAAKQHLEDVVAVFGLKGFRVG